MAGDWHNKIYGAGDVTRELVIASCYRSFVFVIKRAAKLEKDTDSEEFNLCVLSPDYKVHMVYITG